MRDLGGYFHREVNWGHGENVFANNIHLYKSDKSEIEPEPLGSHADGTVGMAQETDRTGATTGEPMG